MITNLLLNYLDDAAGKPRGTYPWGDRAPGLMNVAAVADLALLVAPVLLWRWLR